MSARMGSTVSGFGENRQLHVSSVKSTEVTDLFRGEGQGRSATSELAECNTNRALRINITFNYSPFSVEVDRLCGLVVRVPGYTTKMYCASCEVRTEFIYVM
jgi:hypothetical protein